MARESEFAGVKGNTCYFIHPDKADWTWGPFGHSLTVPGLELAKKLIGRLVWVDYKAVKRRGKKGTYEDHIPDDWDGKPFISHVVGINWINSSQNKRGANRGEVEIQPDHRGDWHSVDLRMLTPLTKAEIAKYTKEFVKKHKVAVGVRKYES